MLTVTSLLVICLLGLLVFWGWLHWKHRRLIMAVKNMEGLFPFCFPIIGHLPYTLIGLEKMTDKAYKWAIEILKKGGSVKAINFWIGPFPLPIVYGVKNVQKLLNRSCTSGKADEMRLAECFLGHGLLTAPSDVWKIKRRHINPLFHPRNLEHMMPTFNRNSEELVSNLSKHIGDGPFNVMNYVMDTALQTICHLIFGPEVEFDTTSQSFRALRQVVESMPEIFLKRIARLWLRIDAVFEFLYRKELNEINKHWKEFTETPLKIAKRKQKTKNSVENQNGHDKSYSGSVKSEELLNLLDVHSVLEEQFPQFDETDLKNEMITLYTTGTDTIGAAVSTCLLLLGKHQDIQEHLYQEISAVDKRGKDVTLEDIQNYTYLDQVYKECLRWSMLVPLVVRKTTEDLTLSNFTIPAGYTVIVAIGANHLDPEIFPNPLSFDPERFSARNAADRETYSFLPFSGGPRNCIGQHYTNMLMKVMLIHILRRYKISTVVDIQNLRKKMVITLISVEGYHIMLEKRNDYD